MEKKNLLILGGSGKVGQWVVNLAKEKGYAITAVVRSKSSLEHINGIRIIEGSVLDNAILKKAIKGQHLVISCLGIKRKSQSNPWSELVSPLNFTEAVANNLVPLMETEGIKRIVAMSAAGVDDSWSLMSGGMKFIVKFSNVKHAFNDFGKMEKLLAKSKVESLVVRPVGLVDKESEKQAQIVDRFEMSSQISRKEVAQWMIDGLERKELINHVNDMIGW